MPTCGNCKKSVAVSDVTCPHCGVLLAAYASPTGSGAAGTYEEPPPPPVTEIPSVDMEVKPPSEADIVTDPTEVAEEPISTAPRPLFDTYLTVEEIAKAAEGDHAEDVVTVAEHKVATKPVVFDVPDYARPPANADPIPTIDEDDDSIPLITRSNNRQPGADPQSGDDEESEPEPEPEPASESWLYGNSPPRQTTRPAPKPEPKPTPPRADQHSGPVGETDEYLRKLHEEAGYSAAEATISRPVEQRRMSPRERSRNRRPTPTFRQQEASEQSAATGVSVLYILVLAMLWLSTIATVMSGSFNTFLIFITIAATWGFGPVRKFIDEMRQS